MKKLILRIYEKCLDFKYRKHDEDICCCGGNISEAQPWDSICAHGGCRSMKEYVIYCSIERLEKFLNRT
jgi:hypothetical protein